MISYIACVGKNRELGRNGDLCWRLKEDLQFFKQNTLYHKVVMGYNTFKSLGKPLKDRENIVLTHSPLGVEGITEILPDEEKKFIRSIKDSPEEIFIIGGAKIYQKYIDLADRIYLTEVDSECEADVFFPEFDKTKYIRKVVGKPREGIEFVIYDK